MAHASTLLFVLGLCPGRSEALEASGTLISEANGPPGNRSAMDCCSNRRCPASASGIGLVPHSNAESSLFMGLGSARVAGGLTRIKASFHSC
jgi:hypothetical protein